ncbi:MAG TPA: Spo0E family sporulation regulatory protein-aspartic acid phosphatase [Clostridium sp.]|nr:Spo0E family sporulation regulatory protein-aspartic acid phosphatase [Clostridium sp.]
MSNIESLREKLHSVLDSGDKIKILTTSQELDKLIANYMLQQLKLNIYAS